MRVISFGLKLILNVAIVRWRFTRTVWKLRWDVMKGFIRESFPLIFSDSLRTLDRQLDTFLLQLWSTVTQIGVFSAVYRLVDRTVILPDSIMSGFFPALSQLHETNRDELQALYQRIFRFFLVLSLPLAVVGTLMPEPLVVLLFSSEYLDSAPVLQVLVWVVLSLFPNYLFKYVLTAVGRQQYETISRFVSLGVHLLMGWYLIPRMGALGAALSVLSAQVILFALGYLFVSRSLQPYLPYRLLAKLAGLTLLAVLLAKVLHGVHDALVIVLTLLIYGAGYLALRVITLQELRAMWAMMRPTGRATRSSQGSSVDRASGL